MRTLIFLAATLLPGAASFAQTPSADRSAPALACTLENVTYDSKEIVCPLPQQSPGAIYRLQVNFSGGHDDTQASLAPTLNDTALSCGEASKTRLIGEDGNVSLYCAFRQARSDAKQVLRAKVTWSHAEYVDYEFSVR